MSSVGKYSWKEIRKPKVEELPDGRKRLTRFYQLPAGWSIVDAEIDAWGTLDGGSSGATGITAGFAGLRLVNLYVDDIGRVREEANQPEVVVVKVYEEIPETAEVQVGQNKIIRQPDGRVEYEAQFLQFSSATATPGTINTTTAPGVATAYLDREEVVNDGCLRRITRRYIQAGLISQDIKVLNGGKLSIVTYVNVRTPSSNPGGYTNIDAKIDNPNGVPIYTYTWAKGTGRVFIGTEKRFFDRVTVTTIKYLDTDDGATPSGRLFDTIEEKQDGYSLWTKRYALAGDAVLGQIIEESTEQRNGYSGAAKLVIYKRSIVETNLVSPPLVYPHTPPSATIGGSVVQVSVNIRNDSGFYVYDYVWAEGYGRIDTKVEYREGGKLLVTTVTYLAVDDGATPSGNLVSTDSRLEQGYELVTKVYVDEYGDGIVSSTVDVRIGREPSDEKLVVYKISRINNYPATPSPTIGGTVVLVSTETRNEPGYAVYTYTWAEGKGTISTTVETKNQGNLVLYRTIALGVPPSDPTTGVIQTSYTTREENGYILYDATWAKGNGRIDTKTETRNNGAMEVTTIRHIGTDSGTTPPGSLVSSDVEVRDEGNVYTKVYVYGIGVFSKSIEMKDGGLRAETWVSYADVYNASTMEPAAGVVVRKDQEWVDGTYRWTTTKIQKGDGTSPTANAAVTFQVYRPFVYPGRAKVLTTTVSTNFKTHDVFLSPPIETDVLANVNISYSANANISVAYTYWAPNEWATLKANYLSWNGYPKSRIEGLRGYRSVSETPITFGGGLTGYLETCLGDRVYGSGTTNAYSIACYGGPADPGGNTYTLFAKSEEAFRDTTGTVYYRHTQISATIPAQDALPV